MSSCAPVRRSFSDERGLGTFHSLGALSKRKHDSLARKFPVFHIPRDDEDEHQSSLDEHSAPPTVPFPSSSPSSSTPRPQLSRGDSAPISPSGRKPLKSSLKSSSSSPAVFTHSHMHLRARSEPSTPAVAPKNVHFPEKDNALATVRVFDRKARPAALSNPGNGDETETEGEDSPPLRFPFPPVITYEIDPTKSSSVPSKFYPHANLLLESLSLSSPSFTASPTAKKPLLTGSVLVRNLTFEKHVGIRFTLDDWQTVSEVSAHYSLSLSSLPSHIRPSLSASTTCDSSPKSGTMWDRFTFTIRLEDYEHSLSARTMWLAAHYRVNSTYPECSPGGEWWDNNAGTNYRVGFRPAVVTAPSPKSRLRRETVSVPIDSLRNQPQPPTTCKEHALGLMIPFTSNNTEIHPVNHDGTDRHSVSPRVGKLNLCNYSPPVAHPASSISFPSMGSPSSLQPSSIMNLELLSPATLRPSSHDDSASPASSTLSTPSVSPMMAPRLIIGGHPATYADGEREEEIMKPLKPGHITDWDWSPKQSARHSTDLGPIPDTISPSRKVVTEDPLYNAFVTQWCFAQESPLNHNSYGPGEIIA